MAKQITHKHIAKTLTEFLGKGHTDLSNQGMQLTNDFFNSYDEITGELMTHRGLLATCGKKRYLIYVTAKRVAG